jgi:3-oxoacyl-[acyl-carrier-protein] synthase II
MVTPLGRTPEELWNAWAAGRMAAAPSAKMDLSPYGISYTSEVRDFEPRKEISNRKLLRLMVDGEPFGLVAVSRAFGNAGLSPADYAPERAGVAIGCHKEGFRNSNLYDALDAATREDGTLDRALLIEDGIRRIPPQTLVEGLANAALYYFAHEFELQGVHHNLIASGSGGLLAIGEAMRSVRREEADLMLAGGYDTWIDWRCIGHLRYLDLLSTASGPPEFVHCPFDRDRTGGIPGEGSGMLILETRERAEQRNVEIPGEVCGFASGTGLGNNQDSLADTFAGVIRRAVDDADCDLDEIDVVHLHGEGSRDGDWIEANAVRRAFADRGDEVPVTTMASSIGLLGNATGPVHALMTLEMLRRDEILPILNLRHPDAEFRLNFVREPIRRRGMRKGLVLQRSAPHHFTAVVVGTLRD